MSEQTNEVRVPEKVTAPRQWSSWDIYGPTGTHTFVTSGSRTAVDHLARDLEEARVELRKLVEDATANRQLAGVVERLEGIASAIDEASSRSEELKADVLLPPMDAMRVQLVPSHSLDRLEEYRSDENKAYLLIGAFLGAILGILSNWATNEDFAVTRPSAALMGFLFVLALSSIAWACLTAHRARRVREHMLYLGVGASPNQNEQDLASRKKAQAT